MAVADKQKIRNNSDQLRRKSMFLYRRTLTACGLLAVFLAGCGKPEAQFEPNLIYLRSQEHQTGDIPADMERDITTAVTALFGTPDAPYVVPSVEGIDQVLDIRRIRIAAGPVRGDQQGRGAGLYRQHCVHCHGITGNGKGPTAAFLNP